jgi:MinD-like ATPase involved in chromosome partitioning or flagellar assembly
VSGRFVVLGLASARSPWFRTVAQWSHNASIPVEFIKCVSAADARAHLASARPFSALLVDGALSALDRDLVDDVHDAGCAVIVVDDVRVSRDWTTLDVDAVINPVFERRDLLEVLSTSSREILRADVFPGDIVHDDPPVSDAIVGVVVGPGGTGTSTVAMALAQGLAARPPYADEVVLCDLARRAELAMLHDIAEVSPTIQELVEAHRSARPPRREIRRMAFSADERGYDLVLGLRRSKYWSALRPRAFTATFDSLTESWRAVVCDTDADIAEADGGSSDVEDRNVMSRTAIERADVVVVVGSPGLKGTHSLITTLVDLLEHDVPPERLLPVVNRAPKSPRARHEITSAVGRLLTHRAGPTAVASPIYLPERRIEDDLRDGARLPAALTEPVTSAFEALRERVGARTVRLEPMPLAAGTLRLPPTGIAP